MTAAVTSAGTASEPGDGVLDLRWAADGPGVPVVNGAFATDVTLPDGAYTATARFTDAAGNVAEATRTFRVVTPGGRARPRCLRSSPPPGGASARRAS